VLLLQGLQQRPAQQEAAREQLGRGGLTAAALGGAQRQQLALPVPVVQRLMDVDALVALQADQASARRRGQRLGDLGLADARLALQQQRLAERGGQEDRDGQRPIGEVALSRERLADRVRAAQRVAQAVAFSSARRVSTRARWRL
jgi:hypothetical protein